jgi:glycosyltransferase involved in cell wall biosynthesis
VSPRVSVIVSTYDRPAALRLVLAGYTRSLFQDFELIVADDGSTDDTAQVVEAFSREASFRVKHVWQPHRGFRLAAARNLAVRSAEGSLLVFTDGDCIPLPDSLRWHVDRCAPLRAQAGNRYLLSKEETERILDRRDEPPALSQAVTRRERRRLVRLERRNRLYSLTGLKARPKLLTANAAVHREDFERANGFDERFIGWGFEDEDLARRLRRLGVKVLDATLQSLMIHLFHPVEESHRPNARSGENYRYFQRGVFLTRPLKGLFPRAAETLTLEFSGEVPSGLAPLELSQDASIARPEVSLLFGKKRCFTRRLRGEVVLRFSAGREPQTPSELYDVLRERL